MDQLSTTISAAIRSAPAFARLGLSMRDERMRERAAEALACVIRDCLEHPIAGADENQLTLPL